MKKLISLKNALENLKNVIHSLTDSFWGIEFKSDSIEYCDKELDIVNKKIENFK